MKYYVKFRNTSYSTEVTQKRFYSLKRRKDAVEEIIEDKNSKKIGKKLRFNAADAEALYII